MTLCDLGGWVLKCIAASVLSWITHSGGKLPPSCEDPQSASWRGPLRELGIRALHHQTAGNPLQYSCLKSPMGRGAWQATVHSVIESQTQHAKHLNVAWHHQTSPTWQPWRQWTLQHSQTSVIVAPANILTATQWKPRSQRPSSHAAPKFLSGKNCKPC